MPPAAEYGARSSQLRASGGSMLKAVVRHWRVQGQGPDGAPLGLQRALQRSGGSLAFQSSRSAGLVRPSCPGSGGSGGGHLEELA